MNPADSLISLIDPNAPDFYPEVPSYRYGPREGEFSYTVYSSPPNNNLYEKHPDETLSLRHEQAYLQKQMDIQKSQEAAWKAELEKERRFERLKVLSQEDKGIKDHSTTTDDDALWRWKYYRRTFIEYGRDSDFKEMITNVRYGEDRYDDYALAEWVSEPEHRSGWWLAAWWHRRCAGFRRFWKDHSRTARLQRAGKRRGRPLDSHGDWDSP